MAKVLCFGELLLRLSPDTEGNWINSAQMPVNIGGAELNVATALSVWHQSSAFCTALPENYLSRQIIQNLQQKNIDTSPVVFAGDRIGIYYLPHGLDVKNAGVIYDRAGSSFASLQPGAINWDKALEDVEWFHLSAICPALSQSAADVCLEALKAARAKSITTSIDLNYRSKLWKYGRQPVDIIPSLAQYCDLIMGNVWAAETMLGIAVDPDIHTKGNRKDYLEQSQKTSEETIKMFPGCKTVANTFRFDQTGEIRYYTTLFTKEQLHVSKEYNTSSVVDKVGSGDCFMAGLIYGHMQRWKPQDIVDFATAAAFKKLFIKGDATTSTVEEIRNTYNQYA